MKMLQIICDSGFEEYLIEELKKEGIESFTKIEKALGKGRSSPPHMDSHIWPGFHVLYFIAVSDEEYNKIKPLLLEIKGKIKKEGFKVFVYEILEEI